MKPNKPSAGLSLKKKSAIVKSAKKGKDFGKKGKGFDAMVNAIEKSGKTALSAKKIAGAQFWRSQKK